MNKKTKIIATQGPATNTEEKLEGLYNAWANVIRFNFSHVNYEEFEKNINKVKKLNSENKTDLALLLDTKWPEIRTKRTDEVIELKKWEEFLMTDSTRENNITTEGKKLIVCNYEYIVPDLEIWDIIQIDSGLLACEVIWKNIWELLCKALNSHSIKWLRHVNLPWVKLKLPGITESDKNDIAFWVKQGFDFIALSFVRNKENIIELQEYLKELNASWIKIISKIESQEALDNIDEIIEYSDWIMIARGDLWVEVPFETLPIIQREISIKCKSEWKFFIVATQMLESMIENPIPTRAEVTDVFNWVMQKADCLMLSWETAMWAYPVEAVKEMSKVILFTEWQVKYKHDYFSRDLWVDEAKKILVKSAIFTWENLWLKALLVFTKTWFTAEIAAAFRPSLPLYSFSYSENIAKKQNALFWVQPFVIEKKTNEENIYIAIDKLKSKNLLKEWDKIIVVYDLRKNGIKIPYTTIIEI